MLLLILMICIVLLIVSIVMDNDDMVIGLALATLFFGVVGGIVLYDFSTNMKAPELIQMYEEENVNIETKVADTINTYINHEKETFTNLNSKESAITLVAAYPELASSDLVKEQINIYNENSAKIKELKEKRIYLSVQKWWLYFGH